MPLTTFTSFNQQRQRKIWNKTSKTGRCGGSAGEQASMRGPINFLAARKSLEHVSPVRTCTRTPLLCGRIARTGIT